MNVVTYQVVLVDESALVTSLNGDPNSAITFDYLPGSVLRGTTINAYLRSRSVSDLAGDPEARRLFFSGQTRFLNAYPVLQGQRTLPAPRSWQTEKNKSTPVYDVALHRNSPASRGAEGFCTISGQVLRFAPVRHTLAVHNERERLSGRPRGNREGTVYRYVSLSEGQTFEAAILCSSAADAGLLEFLLNAFPDIIVGGSGRAGYGKARIQNVHCESQWHEHSGRPASGNRVIVTLLSDAILRNAQGQLMPDVPTWRHVLEGGLNLPTGSLKSSEAYLATAMVGGFNRKWGLPLPQSPVVRMGSVLVLDLSGVKAQALMTLEEAGIGERRAEGFGRIAFSWQTQTTYDVQTADTSHPSAKQNGWINVPTSVHPMLKRLLRREIDQQVQVVANNLVIRPPSSRSLINRIRDVVSQQVLSTTPTLSGITKFLEDIEGKRAHDHLTRARIGSQAFPDWLRELCNRPDQAMDVNRLTQGKPYRTVWEEAQPDWSVYAALKLMDAVMAKAAKQRGLEENNG